MAENDPGLRQPPASRQPDPNLALTELLHRFSPELAEAVHLSAIPHGFGLDLLSALRGTAEGTPELLAAMQRCGFAAEIAAARFAHHGSVRGFLLAQAQRDLAAYREANGRAAAFFEGRIGRGESRNVERDRLEQIYHLLAADEARGLLQLRLAFEGAYATRDLGPAEYLMDYAQEQEPLLSVASREWLRYLRAQLDQAFGQLEPSQEVFAELAESGRDPLLRAQATRSLGESLAAGCQWLAALDCLQKALRTFEDMSLPLEIAATQSAVGSVYANLAGASGGLRPETAATASRAGCWWHVVRHFPFLVYRWFSRRLSILPNVYFGTDYQNWLVIGHLHHAIRWFDRARASMARPGLAESPGVQTARAHIGIRLADLWFQVGRWSRAENLSSRLATDPVVVASPYLAALVRLGQGRSRLARGATQAARDDFSSSLTIFEQLGDRVAAANARALLAEASLAAGDRAAAGEGCIAAAELFYRAGDLVNATENLAKARSLIDQEEEAAPGTRLAEAEEHLKRRVYVARFPGPLQNLFGRIAAYVALPVAYIFIGWLVLMNALLTGFKFVELGIHSLLSATPQLAACGSVLTALAVLLLLLCGGLWLYELMYAAAGLVVSRRLSLSRLVAQQPVYYVADEAGLSQYDGQGQLQHRLAWGEVSGAASFDRGFIRTPLALFSRFLVRGDRDALLVEGIANRYSDLKRVVAARLERRKPPVRMQDHDYVVLDTRWFPATLVVIFAIGVVNFFDWLDLTGQQANWTTGALRGNPAYRLVVSTIFDCFVPWLASIGPLAALLHLLHNRGSIRRAFPHLALEPDWPIWLASALFLAITLGRLYSLTK